MGSSFGPIARRTDQDPRPRGGSTLWTPAQRFRRGHRIRVQVASGAHPRFVRNLGSREPLATGTTLRASEQSIHHAPGRASAILLPMRRP
jgi:hypothetical protein